MLSRLRLSQTLITHSSRQIIQRSEFVSTTALFEKNDDGKTKDWKTRVTPHHDPMDDNVDQIKERHKDLDANIKSKIGVIDTAQPSVLEKIQGNEFSSPGPFSTGGKVERELDKVKTGNPKPKKAIDDVGEGDKKK